MGPIVGTRGGFLSGVDTVTALGGVVTLGPDGPALLQLSADPRVTPPTPTPAVGSIGILAGTDVFYLATTGIWMPVVVQLGEDVGDLDMATAGLSTAVTGTGSMSAVGRGTFGSTGATAGSSARLFTAATPGWSRGKGWGVIAWSRRQHWQIMLTMSTSSTNGKTRFVVGKGVSTAGDPGVRSIGIRVDNLALKGLAHNGSVLDAVDLTTTLVANTTAVIDIISRGDGTVVWYVDGTLKGTSTGGPTGDGTSGDARAIFELENGADSAAVAAALHHARYRVAHS